MPHYRVFVEGTGIEMEFEPGNIVRGFFATRFVSAGSATEAGDQARYAKIFLPIRPHNRFGLRSCRYRKSKSSASLRGHPSDEKNLWPEPVAGKWSAAVKDQLEGSVCRAVCKGSMTLQEGRAIFMQPDWTKEYEKSFELR